MKTLELTALEQNQNFEQDDFKEFEIGQLNDGQIRCYLKDGIRYIALINPQDSNFLWFADEFPYDWFDQDIQNKIDKIFENCL